MNATLSILGLYQFDNTIFDDFALPFTGKDREALIANLVTELAEFEILYPDTGFIKKAIAAWSWVMLPTWERLLKTETLEYNPINNYDRKEEVHESIISSGDRSGSSEANGTAGGDTDTSVNAFGQAPGWELTPKDQTESSANSTSESSFMERDDTSNTRTLSSRVSGNIGVTTTQQMIDEERRISVFRTQWAIINDFKNRFCILVY